MLLAVWMLRFNSRLEDILNSPSGREAQIHDCQSYILIRVECILLNIFPRNYFEISWMSLKVSLSLDIESEAGVTKTCP
ncbi:hypothetical protein P8452_60415 [Trifolium repens]|nr:hypothetical protein P8452_60415 [Trifolium repens]